MTEQMPWVDFELARTTAHRLMPPGPRATRSERAECVCHLREAAAIAPGLVSAATGLPLATDGPNLVVDRPTWASAMVGTADALWQRLGAGDERTLTQKLSGRAVGIQAGSLLALLGTRILGQFDPFASPPRLLLVAPNVMLVERQLAVEPRDFRRWVALHEQTHRVQFAAAPWLADHLIALLSEALASEEGESLLGSVLHSLRRDEVGDRAGNGALLDAFSSPQTRHVLDPVTAVMSLLEGHADVVMDLAGPEVVPSLAAIRSRFDARREQHRRLRLSRLTGMDAKLAQYEDGAVFCRAVLEVAGHPGLNRVFERLEHLPTREELADPDGWMLRVLGLARRDGL